MALRTVNELDLAGANTAPPPARLNVKKNSGDFFPKHVFWVSIDFYENIDELNFAIVWVISTFDVLLNAAMMFTKYVCRVLLGVTSKKWYKLQGCSKCIISSIQNQQRYFCSH